MSAIGGMKTGYGAVFNPGRTPSRFGMQKRRGEDTVMTVYGAPIGRDHTKGFDTYTRVSISLSDQREKLLEKRQQNKQREAEYNHKKYPTKIRRAKTAQSIRQVAAEIRAEIEDLYTKLQSGEYDQEEIMAAIKHAEAMEQAALHRADHLAKEEMAERKMKREEAEEKLRGEDEEEGVLLVLGDAGAKENKTESERAIDAEMKKAEEEMKRKMQEEAQEALMEEMEKLMEETRKEDPLSSLDEMADILSGSVSEEDLEEMKKKHRAAEEMEMTRADMDYLKAKFYRLQQQKEALKSGGATALSANGHTSSPQVPMQTKGMVAGAKVAAASLAGDVTSSASASPACVGTSVDISG